jgi:hypothetical protein
LGHPDRRRLPAGAHPAAQPPELAHKHATPAPQQLPRGSLPRRRFVSPHHPQRRARAQRRRRLRLRSQAQLLEGGPKLLPDDGT